MKITRLAAAIRFWESKQAYGFRGCFNYELYCRIIKAKSNKHIDHAETPGFK